jgi:chromosome segregation ATPase
MKRRRLWMLVGIVLAMGVTACAGTSQANRETVPPEDPVIGLLSKGITQLNVNINALSKRMNDVHQASTGTDPALRELQALDLSGWQLHQQQWILQRDHLIAARESLRRASGQPGQKKQLLDQWQQHQQQYVKALEELRQERQKLENKHLEVEARLIEHRLQ